MQGSADDSTRLHPAIKRRRSTLLVSNLPNLPEAELRKVFSNFGEVTECEVLHDARGNSRGFAFVQMRDPRCLHHAKRELDGTLPFAAEEGQLPLRVRWSLDTHTLCVSDLGPDVTSQQLNDAFSQFGNIVSCRVELEPHEFHKRSKLHGFVEFSKRSIASKVQQLLSDNLFMMGNTPRPLRVDFAVDDAFDDSEGAPVDPNFKPTPAHFAVPGSLEFDFALRWRELSLAHQVERERLGEVHRQEREVLRQEQADVYKNEFHKFQTLDPNERVGALGSSPPELREARAPMLDLRGAASGRDGDRGGERGADRGGRSMGGGPQKRPRS